MADIQPFHGIRYNIEKVTSLREVFAPPYDVISPEQQDALHDRHPNNVVRLILGKEGAGDSETENKYTRAARWFREWQASEVLMQEDQPAFYVYDQVYKTPEGETRTRRGVFAAVRLEPWEAGIIRPHEFTHAGPKQDRLNLFRAAKANFSPIFGLYDDPDSRVDGCLSSVDRNPPEMEATDDDGVIHRLWRIQDAQVAEQIRASFRGREILIADGHHRYETSLAYRDELKAQSPNWSDDAPANFTLMVLVNLRSPGLTIFPTHRVADLSPEGKSLDLDQFLTSAEEFFTIDELPRGEDVLLPEALRALRNLLHTHCFVFITRNRSWVLQLRPEALQHPLLPADKSVAFRELDVTLLHTFIIEHILGGKDVGCRLTYVKDAAEGVATVRAGQHQMIFLLNPTRLDEVQAVAQAGEKMPQKSTYFYPKLYTGLVMRKLA